MVNGASEEQPSTHGRGQTAAATRRRRQDQPIGRGPQARERVLHAALEVLSVHGRQGFNMEAVARQAAASKATLYRHWPSAGALLIDAMDRAFRPLSPPTTGELESDLTEILVRGTELLAQPTFPRLMAAFIDAAEHDPALAGQHAELTRQRREPVLHILEQARQRGEIPLPADLELAVDLLTGPLFYSRFVAHRPLPASYLRDLVDHVLRAIRHPNLPGASADKDDVA